MLVYFIKQRWASWAWSQKKWLNKNYRARWLTSLSLEIAQRWIGCIVEDKSTFECINISILVEQTSASWKKPEKLRWHRWVYRGKSKLVLLTVIISSERRSETNRIRKVAVSFNGSHYFFAPTSLRWEKSKLVQLSWLSSSRAKDHLKRIAYAGLLDLSGEAILSSFVTNTHSVNRNGFKLW